MLCRPGRESSPSRQSESSQGSRAKWRRWTPGDGLWVSGWVGKASPGPRVPLVISTQDAMNDVELRIAQPLTVPACTLSWCASVQTFRLGIYCVQQKHIKPFRHGRVRSSTVTASRTAWIAYAPEGAAPWRTMLWRRLDISQCVRQSEIIRNIDPPSGGTARHRQAPVPARVGNLPNHICTGPRY